MFKSLGIAEWNWEQAHDGVTLSAFGLSLKPRDFAKLGQLLVQNRKWNNTSIVDSVWIAEASAGQLTVNSFGSSYGYYSWFFPSYPGYAALGHGGQAVCHTLIAASGCVYGLDLYRLNVF